MKKPGTKGLSDEVEEVDKLTWSETDVVRMFSEEERSISCRQSIFN